MAIFDAMLELSDDQSITATDSISTNIIDFQNSDLEMGAGTPLWLNVKVGTSCADCTSIAFSLYSHSGTTVSSGTALWSKTVTSASGGLAANSWIIRMPLPVDVDMDRYVGLYYDVTGTAAGTINAWIDHGPQSSYDTQVSASNI